MPSSKYKKCALPQKLRGRSKAILYDLSKQKLVPRTDLALIFSRFTIEAEGNNKSVLFSEVSTKNKSRYVEAIIKDFIDNGYIAEEVSKEQDVKIVSCTNKGYTAVREAEKNKEKTFIEKLYAEFKENKESFINEDITPAEIIESREWPCLAERKLSRSVSPYFYFEEVASKEKLKKLDKIINKKKDAEVVVKLVQDNSSESKEELAEDSAEKLEADSAEELEEDLEEEENIEEEHQENTGDSKIEEKEYTEEDFKKLQREYKRRRRKNIKTIIRKSTAENIMFCSGVMTDEADKPSIEALISILSAWGYENTFAWQLVCRFGIYYSRQECGDIVKSVGEDGKAMQGYLVGLLFTKVGWYVVYNTLNKRQIWFKSTEELNVKKISVRLAACLPYTDCEARTIILAHGVGMLSALATNRTHGINYKQEIAGIIRESLEKRSDNKAKTFEYINMEGISSIFNKAYFAETNSSGINAIVRIVNDEYSEVVQEYQKLARNQGFHLTFKYGGCQAYIEEGRRYLICNAPELIELWHLFKDKDMVMFKTTKHYAEQLSKIVGMKLNKIIDGDFIRKIEEEKKAEIEERKRALEEGRPVKRKTKEEIMAERERNNRLQVIRVKRFDDKGLPLPQKL